LLQEGQVKELHSWRSTQEASFREQKKEMEALMGKLRQADSSLTSSQTHLQLVEKEKQHLVVELRQLRTQLKQQLPKQLPSHVSERGQHTPGWSC